MLEGWKRLLAGDTLTRAEVMHFVSLAEYNTESGRKERHIATPSRPRRGRGTELNTSDDECDFAEATSMAGSLAETSTYVGHDSPESVRRAVSNDMDTPASNKKRRVDDC